MIKRIGYLLFSIVVIALLAIVALFAAMHTHYATPIVNQLLASTGQKIKIEQATYHAPLELSLQGVTIGQESEIYLPKVNVWLSSRLPSNNKLQLDALVIEEANLNLSDTSLLSQLPLETKQLALNYSDLSWGEISARQVKLQITHPQWQTKQAIPFGDIQFSSEQVYLHGQALDNVLFDIDYKPTNSTVYGASFNWNGAQISGQAEHYLQGWSLINVTIKQLNLSNADQPLDWLTELNPSAWIRDINSLDLLNCNINYQDIELQNLDLSLENWQLTQGLWQQSNGYLSFDADSIEYQQQQFVEPSATLYFKLNQIDIAELDSDWQQGRIQLQGRYSPHQVELKNVSLSGIKWLDISTSQLTQLKDWGQSLQQVDIAQLDINNAQAIQLAQKPFWQISGLNAQGNDLSLKHDGRWGLWRGKVQLTANSASYNNYLTTQAIIEMSNQKQVWQLDRLFLPLESGYIEASGQWDKKPLSAPWQLDVTIDGLPLQTEIDTQPQPLQMKWVSDIHAQLSGLAGDFSMLSHSLSGQADLTLREGYLSLGDTQQKPSFEQPFSIDDVTLNADRGRITIDSTENSAPTQVAGKIDLANRSLTTLLLQTQHNCQQLQTDLSAKVYQLSDICSPLPKSPTPKPQQTESKTVAPEVVVNQDSTVEPSN